MSSILLGSGFIPITGDDNGSSPSDSGNEMNTSSPGHRPPHPSRAKRSWSEQEDAVLVEVLLELHNTGKFKADRGFKPGLYAAVEKELERCIPGCGIRADPHIYSGMKTLKGHYNVVHDMLYQNCSDFGWDPISKCAVAEDDVWTSYIQTHKAAAQFRGRAFKYFDDLAVIFGTDRANVKGAIDHARAAVFMSPGSDMPVDISSDELPDNDSGDPVWERGSPPTPPYVKKRKLSCDELFFSAMKDNTAMIVASMDRSTDKLCAALTRSDLHNKRAVLANTLREIPTLTSYMRINAHRIIGCDKELLDVFYTVSEDDLAEWVRAVLDHAS